MTVGGSVVVTAVVTVTVGEVVVFVVFRIVDETVVFFGAVVCGGDVV